MLTGSIMVANTVSLMAVVISMLVALMIKGIYLGIRLCKNLTK